MDTQSAKTHKNMLPWNPWKANGDGNTDDVVGFQVHSCFQTKAVFDVGLDVGIKETWDIDCCRCDEIVPKDC